MNIVVHITENPRIGPIWLQLQPSPLTQMMISTHSPYSSQLCLSLCGLQSTWLFLSHIKMATNSQSFQQSFSFHDSKIPDFILMTLPWVTCSPCTSNCDHRTGMLWWAGGEVNGKLNHVAWECRRHFCYKTNEEMDDGQRKTICFHYSIFH